MSDTQQEISRETVRERINSALESAIINRDDTLLIAPPASGKSSQLFQVIQELDVPALYASSLRQLNEQAEAWCDDVGVSSKVLPTISNDCKSWEDNESVRKAYGRGASPREIHERQVCQFGRNCPYIQRIPEKKGEDDNEYVPKSEGQVLIGDPAHTHVPPYVNRRVIILDDVDASDAFLEEYDEIGKLCQAYLDDERFPADTEEQLYALKSDENKRTEALKLLDDVDFDPFDDGFTHKKAPAIIRTILEHEPLDNGFGQYAGPPEERFWGVTDGAHNVHLLEYPDLSPAQVVIGLDAYPMLFTDDELPIWWWLWTGQKLESKKILSDQEMRIFTEDVLNISVIQTNDHAKPYSSGRSVSPQSDQKLLDFISKQHGVEKPPVISTKSALNQLDIARSMNFNEMKSRNKFQKENVGVILGSPHPGDPHLQLIAAFMDQSIDGEGKDMEKDYGEIGNVIFKRYRESMVAQAIHRFGRHPDIESSAVYVHTAAIPDSILVEEKPPEFTDSFVSCENQVRIVLEEAESPLKIAEIADRTTCSYDRVRNLMDKLDFQGVIEEYEPSGGIFDVGDGIGDAGTKRWVLRD